MTDHDPRAADVLALSRAHTGRRDRPDLIDRRGAFHALNALAAAGLVVRPAADSLALSPEVAAVVEAAKAETLAESVLGIDLLPQRRARREAVDALLAAQRASTEGDDRD